MNMMTKSKPKETRSYKEVLQSRPKKIDKGSE
jgi:hypothetical protein